MEQHYNILQNKDKNGDLEVANDKEVKDILFNTIGVTVIPKVVKDKVEKTFKKIRSES